MGLLGAYKESVTLVNRTSRILSVRYDGEDTTIRPGENPGFPKVAVPFAKRQNILKGSRHPVNPNLFVCLVGVKDTKDDITPISDETLEKADAKYEAIDRDGEFWGEPERKVKLMRRNPKYSAYESRTELPSEYAVNPNIQ